jgi:hypothetical protein
MAGAGTSQRDVPIRIARSISDFSWKFPAKNFKKRVGNSRKRRENFLPEGFFRSKTRGLLGFFHMASVLLK